MNRLKSLFTLCLVLLMLAPVLTACGKKSPLEPVPNGNEYKYPS